MSIEAENLKNVESIETIPGDKLYLLVSQDGTMFKIGITANIAGRIQQLQTVWGGLDLHRSCLVAGDDLRVRGLESMLHFLFSNENIAHGNSQDGHTEWFNIDCLDRVVEEIERVAAIKEDAGIVLSKGINLPKKPERESTQTLLAKKEIRLIEILDGNKDQAEQFTSFSSQIQSYVTGVEEFQEHGSLRKKVFVQGPVEEIEPILSLFMQSGQVRSLTGAVNVIDSFHSTDDGETIKGELVFNIAAMEEFKNDAGAEFLVNTIQNFLNKAGD